MQRFLLLAALFAGTVALSGCPKNPYGPSSDERLEMATSNVGGVSADIDASNAGHLAELSALSCMKEKNNYDKLSGPGEPEEGQIAGYTGLVRALREKRDKVQAILQGHPGLRYHTGKAADGNSYDIPTLVRICEQTLLDTEYALDKLVRDILDVPIVYTYEGKGRRRREIPKERIDFDLLLVAVNTLQPADSDVLTQEIGEAKERLEEEKKDATKRRRWRRRRRRR